MVLMPALFGGRLANQSFWPHKLFLGAFLVFCFFFVVFYSGKGAFFVNENWFRGHQVDSDDLVFKSLVYARFSDSGPPLGLLAADRGFQLGAYTGGADYRARYSGSPAASPPGAASRYLSQLGLQPFIVYPAYWVSFLSSNPDIGRNLHRGARGAVVIVVALNALAMTALVLWLRREFSSVPAALFALALPTLAPWLIVFGHSVYWMMWSWFLPFLISLWGWRQMAPGHKREYMPAALYGAMFLSFVLKMSMGYEYISTVALAASTPVVYYGIRDGWGKIRVLLHIALTALAAVAAFAVTLSLHAISIAATQAWTFTHSLSVIYSKFAQRSWEAFVNFEIGHDVIKKSVSSGIFEVLGKYVFEGPQPWEIWIILSTVAVLGWYYLSASRHDDDRAAALNVKALSLATAYSALAPLSHLIIMKGHSYIHTHMNYVLWNLPLNIFCLVTVIHCVTSRLRLTLSCRVRAGRLMARICLRLK
jgi:hypothetical protein